MNVKCDGCSTSEDWINWYGGECPVEEGVLLDVKYRDGHVELGIPALRPYSRSSGRRTAMNWLNTGLGYNIIAYRLHQVSAEEAAAGELENGTKIKMITEHDVTPVADLTMDAPGYERLADVLMKAYLQSSDGKGKERHADGDVPFHEQPIITIQKMVGSGFATGQAIKKIEESKRMDLDAACRELLGAIVYIAGAVVHLEDRMKG